jgi:hypothetical protein
LVSGVLYVLDGASPCPSVISGNLLGASIVDRVKKTLLCISVGKSMFFIALLIPLGMIEYGQTRPIEIAVLVV